MKVKKFITAAAFLVGGYFLIRSFQKRTIAKINYAAGGFRVQHIDLKSVEFRVGMTITNESDVPAPISNFIGRLIYNWPDKSPSVLGDLFLVEPKQLPGFGQVNLEFRMVSSITGSAFEILNILTNGNPFSLSSINYKNVDMTRFKIIGTLKIGPLPLDIDTTLV